MAYDDVFDDVLRALHQELGCRQRDGRRGDLRRADGRAEAVCNAYHYQRSHMDAFLAAMVGADSVDVGGEVVEVVDIGCGAASVALALAELWTGDASPEVVDYTGIDHNRHARALANEMLGVERPDWLMWQALGRVVPPPRDDVDRSLIVLSYVLQQSGVDAESVDTWAGAIVDRLDVTDCVEVVVTCVNSELATRNWWPFFVERLNELAPGTEVASTSMRVDNRFPGPRSGWEVKGPGWSAGWRNVVAHICTVAS